ncbi:hypothetical protein HCH52_00640 [Oscillospiraceae bacterium HV4-5-C5C]|nr:hypothetical protein [Oscillospiraceae bacterium HV4-5-C5C]
MEPSGITAQLSQTRVTSHSAVIFRILLTVIWLYLIEPSSANFIVYALIAALAVAANTISWFKASEPGSRRERTGLIILALILTLFTTAANYELLWLVAGVTKLVKILLFLVSGYSVFSAVLRFIFPLTQVVTLVKADRQARLRPVRVFMLAFGLIAVVDLLYLFLAAYPGILSLDSMGQIRQVITGNYLDHHPIYHTFLIKLFYDIGMACFGSVNAAVATYCVAQILMMAAAFAFAVMTLAQAGLRRRLLWLVLLIFALTPYHVIYSVTIWKDVLFGGAVLFFITCLYRCRRQIGHPVLNDSLYFFSALAFCLLRSNAIYAFVLVALVLLIQFHRQSPRLVLLTVLALALAAILKGPVVTLLQIERTDIIESLSVPEQQIARYITDGNPLTAEETALLSQVIDLDKVSSQYDPGLSDPIKALLRDKDSSAILEANKADFLRLYITLGLRAPFSYIEAWIDQTKGYWNAGYAYWITNSGVVDNEFGIHQTIVVPLLASLADKLSQLMIGRLITSNGLCTWLYLLGLGFALISRRKTYLETVPPLAIVATLLLATPVYNEFRYVYGLYTALPFVALTCLIGDCQPLPGALTPPPSVAATPLSQQSMPPGADPSSNTPATNSDKAQTAAGPS